MAFLVATLQSKGVSWVTRDHVRTVLAVCALLMAQTVFAQDAGPVSTITGATERWIQQGGFALAVFIVGYFYRKDFLDERKDWVVRDQQLVNVITSTTATNTKLTELIEQLIHEVRGRPHP